MKVALIAETGIRFMDVSVLVPEIRVPTARRVTLFPSREAITKVPLNVRRFVRMDDHTYVEKP